MKLAILTGDLVGSTALPADDLDRALGVLRDTAQAISVWDDHDTRFTRYRGDGWQICLAPPTRALRAALVMRAALKTLGKGYETRIGLAVGRVFLPEQGDLNGASGAGFVASGRALDGLTGSVSMAHTRAAAMGAATRLADHISRSWTPAQARAMALMLHANPPTHAQVAAQTGVTRQAVDQALRSAGFPALSDALNQIEGQHE